MQRVIKLICAERKFEEILVAFEGHGWERATFATLNGCVDSSTRVIGYLHVAPFDGQYGLSATLPNKFQPALLAFTGKSALKQFNDIYPSAMTGADRTVLGCNRHAPASILEDKVKVHKKILMIPEAFHTEIALMIDVALVWLASDATINIVIRLHPDATEINWKDHIRKNGRSGMERISFDRGPNFLSRIEQFSLAVFRGSTLGVEVAARGMAVAYLEYMPDEQCLSPIQGFDLGLKVIRAWDGSKLNLQSIQSDQRLQQFVLNFFEKWQRI